MLGNLINLISHSTVSTISGSDSLLQMSINGYSWVQSVKL